MLSDGTPEGNGGSTQSPLLTAVFPALAAELDARFRADSRPELADQVAALRVESWCECGEDFCQSFRTVARWPEDYDGCTVTYDTPSGTLNVDVQQARILGVEALFYPPLC